MKKRLLSMILALSMMLTILPVNAITALAATDDIVASGSCGNGADYNKVTYKVIRNNDDDTNRTYTLKIEGMGAMGDYEGGDPYHRAPWYDYYGNKITKIVIESGVTTIGKDTFHCENLKSVEIPNTVTSIGDRAFYMFGTNTTWKKLKIPDSVTSIGAWAFYQCKGLSGELTIPSSVTSIGEGAFSGCSGFTGKLSIPNSITEINGSTFYNCSGLTNVEIPSSVTAIGVQAFSGCSGLTGTLIIPDSVTSIGKEAFYSCKGLTGVTLPKDVTTISEGTFEWCNGLTSIAIPNKVTTIEKRAFYQCGELSGVLAIPNSVTSIGESAFESCKKLSGTLIIPNKVTTIGDSAFKYCMGLSGSLNIPNSVTSIGQFAFYCCSGLNGTLTIPDSVTEISANAFANCSGLTSVEIPNTVTTIGDHAFYGCKGMTSITIPEGVTSICQSAFNDCTFDSVKIPSSVTSIGKYAFGRKSLKKVELPQNVPSIDGAFDYSGISKLYYPGYKTDWLNQPNVTNGSVKGLTSDKKIMNITDSYDGHTVWIGYYIDVPFDANGGVFEDDTDRKTVEKARHGDNLTQEQIDSVGIPKKAGKVCIGWSTDASATTPMNLTYYSSATVDDDTVFYAVYRNAKAATIGIGSSNKMFEAGTASEPFAVNVQVNDNTEATKVKFEFANGTVQYKNSSTDWSDLTGNEIEIDKLDSTTMFRIMTPKSTTARSETLTAKLVTEQGIEIGVNATANFGVTANNYTHATVAIDGPANKNVKAGEPSQTFTMNITNHDDEVGNVTFDFDGEVQYADNTYGPNWTTVTGSVSRAIATSKYFRVVPKADAAAGDMTLTAKLVDTDGNEITGATASTTFNVAARENATVTIGKINNGDELMKGNSYEFTVTVNPKDDKAAGKTGKLTFDDTTGLKYWDGSKWADIPTGGVSVDMSKERIEQKFQLTPSTAGNNQTLTATLTKADNSIVTGSTNYNVREHQRATVTINGPADKNIKVGRLSKFFGIKIDPKDDTVGSVRFSFDGEVLYATDRNGIMTDVNGNIASTIAEKSYFWVQSSNVGSKILTVQLVDTNGNDITGASDSIVLNVTDLIHATVTIGNDLKNQTIKQNEPCNFTVNVALKDDASSYVTLTFDNVDGLTYEGNPVTNEGVKFYLSRSLQTLNFTLTPSDAGTNKTLTATLSTSGATDTATFNVTAQEHANVTIDGLDDDLKQGESKDFTVKVDPKDDSGEAIIDFGDKNSEIQYKDPADNQWKNMPTTGGLKIDLGDSAKDYEFRITPKNDGDQTLTATVKQGDTVLGETTKDFTVTKKEEPVNPNPGGDGGNTNPGGDGGNTNPGGDGGNTNPGGDGGNTNPGGDGGNTKPGGDSGNTGDGGNTKPGDGDHTGDKDPETKSYELTVIGGSFTAKQGENALTVETTKADNSLTAKIPEGAVVTVTLNKDTVPEGMVFDQWKINDDDLMGNPDVAYDQETFHFTMPEHDVKVEVMYRDATIESDGPGILGTGAMIATVGISAAALAYQGHMLGTEFALRCMLPEWALIPQNRAELAVLLWQDADSPEPVSTNLYSDISEDDSAVQKAARWAVENDLMELLDAEEAPENFDPFVPVTYLDSIHAWKKAQELKKA